MFSNNNQISNETRFKELEGGALYASFSTITIQSCSFSHNSVNSLSRTYGGAVYVHSCNITLNNCEFHSNTVASGSGASGGALCVISSNVSVSGCKFINNTAVGHVRGEGGGVYIHLSNVSLNENDFIENSVIGGEFRNSRAYGGAVAVYESRFVSIYIDDCNFTNNSIIADDGRGGALTCFDCFNISITNSLFFSNTIHTCN